MCTCASANVVKLPWLSAVRLWDLRLSWSHLCQRRMEKVCPGDRIASSPHRLIVAAAAIYWNLTYRCFLTSVGQSGGKPRLGCIMLGSTGVCVEKWVSVSSCWAKALLCANISVEIYAFIIIIIKWILVYLRGKALGAIGTVSRVAPALGISHVRRAFSCGCTCTLLRYVFHRDCVFWYTSRWSHQFSMPFRNPSRCPFNWQYFFLLTAGDGVKACKSL